MKKVIMALMILATVLALAACTSGSPSGTRKLVLLQTSDEHSFLLAVGPEVDDYKASASNRNRSLTGGIARRKTVLDRERAAAAAAGAATLTVSSGDNMMGTLFQAAGSHLALDYRAMKALGYDIGCFGNHDFELGPGFLAESLATAVSNGGMFPIVASNIHFSGNPGAADAAMAALFDDSGRDGGKPIHRRWVITAANGLKVGFVGIMGATAAVDAPGKTPITFSLGASRNEHDHAEVLARMYEELQLQVNALRSVEKADLVIALGHTGTDIAEPALGESWQIARNVTDIDVVLSGHTHLTVPAFTVTNPASGKEVVIQEPGRYGDHLAKLTLLVASDGSVSVDTSIAATAMIPLDAAIEPAAAMRPFVDAAVTQLEQAEEWPGSGKSMLERTLSAITGTAVAHTSALGDLYFFPLGKTDFALPLLQRRETGMLRLLTDGMLAAARERNPGGRTDIAVAAAGFIRDGIWLGTGSDIAFADIFRILPLLQSIEPVHGAYHTPGSPLLRFAVDAGTLKGILETAASTSYASVEASGYFTFPSGLRFTYDTTLAPFDPSNPATTGRVTGITLADDPYSDTYGTAIYSDALGRMTSGWRIDPRTTYYVMVSDYYLVQFLVENNIKLRRPEDPSQVYGSPVEAVIRHDDGSEYKTYESLASQIRTSSAGNPLKPGFLPVRYAGTAPLRALCSGPLCE